MNEFDEDKQKHFQSVSEATPTPGEINTSHYGFLKLFGTVPELVEGQTVEGLGPTRRSGENE